MKRIDLIAGARHNFIKIAPIIDALNAAETRGGSFRFRLIHTGQHYDRVMSGSFFEELSIPDPDINLEVGSGTQAEQTAAIMVAYEKVLLKGKSEHEACKILIVLIGPPMYSQSHFSCAAQ
ncbi:MAG: UDP-N-acetylglucosamine 2-epimerase [Pyrinomonadaceae bacterium]|nr:UDP-N-acetylglucosamine 2-epimerase [Pyrinomonadaceae bacterium]